MSTPNDSDPFETPTGLPKAPTASTEGYGMPASGPKPPAPPSILLTAKLMLGGAALSIILGIINIATIGTVKTYLRNHGKSESTVNSDARQIVTTAIISMILGTALWIWMSYSVRAGKMWARVLATIFFAISTISLLFSFGSHGSALGLVIGLLVWAYGLYIIVLLYKAESSQYFRA